MKKYFSFLLFVVVFGLALKAQPNMEIGVSGGAMYYVGDLNPTQHLNPELMQFAYGIFHRGNFNGRFGVKTQLAIGKVKGDDALSTDLIQAQRNLSFSTDIYELTSVVEFNFFSYSNFNKKEKVSPYLYGCLGFFLINPQTEYLNNLYDLRAYNTEGQVESYNSFQASFPFGAGVKFKPVDRLSLHFDWGMRKTFTDYLDDVSTLYPNPNSISSLTATLSNQSTNQLSALNNNWLTQRGNSKTNDWYSFINIGLSFRLTNDPSNCHFNPF